MLGTGVQVPGVGVKVHICAGEVGGIRVYLCVLGRDVQVGRLGHVCLEPHGARFELMGHGVGGLWVGFKCVGHVGVAKVTRGVAIWMGAVHSRNTAWLNS